MKKIIPFLLAIFLVNSCSTNSDGTKDTVPLPPTNLTGNIISKTQINLSWTDNSTNETGFKIERKTVSGTYAVVANTSTDITTFSDNGLTPGTTYIYRVYSYNVVGNSLTYSNELTLTTSNIPIVTTTATSVITTSTASSGGTISSDGGATVTARGVVWSTSSNPTTALSTKTINGTGTGTFVSAITGLTGNTTYFIRAYATNSAGTSYGNELTLTIPIVTDIDGNLYQTVTICNQTWTKTNLTVTKYRNGDVIPQVTNSTQWASLTTGAWCYYQNNTSNGTTYGKLYNWYAVNDPRGLAPVGYHIPSDAEWTTLTTCLGGKYVAGGEMKETGTVHWTSPNTGATNSSSFTGLPGGWNNNSGTSSFIGNYGSWWSSTEHDTSSVWFWTLNHLNGNVEFSYFNKKYGLSVRCLRD